MTKVLIVSKTRMRSGLCVGGLTLQNNIGVRLLTTSGQNQPSSTKFSVGDVWDLEIRRVQGTIPPHTEDVRVINQTHLGKMENMARYLEKNAPCVFPPNPEMLFDGLVQFTNRRKAYISQQSGVPNHSTGFWKTDRQLHICFEGENQQKIRYRFADHSFLAPYVGFASPIETIPANTLIRVSLARWWTPNNAVNEERRCYLQISGWY